MTSTTATSLTSTPARPMPSGPESQLYQLCQQRWNDAERRAVVDRGPYCSSVWLIDVATATEMEIREEEDGYLLTVIDIVAETPTCMCLCAPTEQEQVVCDGDLAAPVPDEVTRRLRSARLLPPEGVIYGVRRGARTVALMHTWAQHGEYGEVICLHDVIYVLQGCAEPDLHTTRQGRTYLDASRWWAAVDRGEITPLDRDIADSLHRVDSYKRAGAYRDICAHGPEIWTGIDGPALYSHRSQDGTPVMTLDQALNTPGDDIRALQGIRASHHGR